jgi:predicted alpha/beta-hydrolase family hydrolase
MVSTPAGDARVTWFPAAGAPRAVLALGHGAGGGIEARDLRALAAAVPPSGISVALVEQPWRVAGRRLAPAPKALDAAWTALWPALARPGLPLIAGGRSAGARVACRTAGALGAEAVLALSFPLHPPGRPDRSRAGELLDSGVPTLVVQGGRDPFGRPGEFPEPFCRPSRPPRLPAAPGERQPPERSGSQLVTVPYGDHGFALPKSADITQQQALTVLTDAVTAWLAPWA